jgi:Mce-associated membrane protein
MAVDAGSPRKLSELTTPPIDPDESASDAQTERAAEPTFSAKEPEPQPSDADEAQEGKRDDTETADDADAECKHRRKPLTPALLACVLGAVVVVTLGGVSGWLGYRAYHSHQAQQNRELFVRIARQGALNLTTIDWRQADADVKRILDSATGTFYDDFSKRSQPFIDVVKQAQSTSVGTITEAGLESASAEEAQVLVAVAVRTSNVAGPQQVPRGWRMRITVQKVGDQAKISNVAFVP